MAFYQHLSTSRFFLPGWYIRTHNMETGNNYSRRRASHPLSLVLYELKICMITDRTAGRFELRSVWKCVETFKWFKDITHFILREIPTAILKWREEINSERISEYTPHSCFIIFSNTFFYFQRHVAWWFVRLHCVVGPVDSCFRPAIRSESIGLCFFFFQGLICYRRSLRFEIGRQ